MFILVQQDLKSERVRGCGSPWNEMKSGRKKKGGSYKETIMNSLGKIISSIFFSYPRSWIFNAKEKLAIFNRKNDLELWGNPNSKIAIDLRSSQRWYFNLSPPGSSGIYPFTSLMTSAPYFYKHIQFVIFLGRVSFHNDKPQWVIFVV